MKTHKELAEEAVAVTRAAVEAYHKNPKENPAPEASEPEILPAIEVLLTYGEHSVRLYLMDGFLGFAEYADENGHETVALSRDDVALFWDTWGGWL